MATAGDEREAVAVAAEIHRVSGMGATVYASSHSGIRYYGVSAFPRVMIMPETDTGHNWRETLERRNPQHPPHAGVEFRDH